MRKAHGWDIAQKRDVLEELCAPFMRKAHGWGSAQKRDVLEELCAPFMRKAHGWDIAQKRDPFRIAYSAWPGSFKSTSDKDSRAKVAL